MSLKHRISALLLVLVMCLSLFAVPAYAYGNDPDPALGMSSGKELRTLYAAVRNC